MRGLKCRFISCVLLCAVLCSFLCLSAGASNNTIGVIQSDLSFLGLSITSGRPGSLSSIGFFSASDGICYKRYKNSAVDYDLSKFQYLSFIFDCSQVVGECDISANLVVAAPGFTCDEVRVIGGVLSDGIYNYTYLKRYDFTWFNPSSNEFASCVLKDISADLTNYDIVVLMLHNSSSTAVLDTSFSFSESASITGSYSGSSSPNSRVYVKGSDIWDTNIVADQYSDIIYEYDGKWRWWDPNAGITLEVYADFNSMYMDLPDTTDSGTMSLSETGIISASSATDVMAYGVLSATYGSDGGLNQNILDQTGVIQQGNEDTQQAINDTAQATQDTITEETEKQTSAIGGFFDKLLQGIKDFFTSLFIPDDIATSGFTQLLEDKLGIIYQIPAMIVSLFKELFDAFGRAGVENLVFPGWSYDGYVIIPETIIRRSDYSAIFDIIDPVMITVGSIIVVFLFCRGVKKLFSRIVLGGVVLVDS